MARTYQGAVLKVSPIFVESVTCWAYDEYLNRRRNNAKKSMPFFMILNVFSYELNAKQVFPDNDNQLYRENQCSDLSYSYLILSGLT